MFTLWWLHSAIFQFAAWHHAGQQCAAMCELAGSQLPTGSRMALLARWAISASRMQLPLSCVMLFPTDHLLFSIHSSMICLPKHWGHLTFGTLFTTPCPVAPRQSRWEACFFSPLLIFSLSWWRPCRNLILHGTVCCHPPETTYQCGRQQTQMISSWILVLGLVPHTRLSELCSNISKTLTAFLFLQWVSSAIHLLRNKVPVFVWDVSWESRMAVKWTCR